MKWQPATVEEVRQIVEQDLLNCDAEQIVAFKIHAIEPYYGRIVRYGQPSTVVVVARNGQEVIYWEDVEEGFNVSPIAPDGEILEHWCNQDDLGLTLNAWIRGRNRTLKLGPAEPIE
jgi:hypothetical protein